MNFHLRGCCPVVVTALLSAGCAESAMTAAAAAVVLPDPAVDEPVAASKGQPAAVFAGGCFWGVDAVFKHVRGVTRVTSGYAGGSASTAVYDVGSTEAIMQNVPWNTARLTGKKRPLKPKELCAIRVRLRLEHRARDLALQSASSGDVISS